MEIFVGLIIGFANKYTLVILTLAVVAILLFIVFQICGTLQRYVLREVFSTFLIALVALVLITFLGLCLKLLSMGFNIVHVPIIIPFLILFSLPFAIPAALLTSVVMTCGRMSGDNEITAVRSSGIHLYLVITPIVLCGTLMSIFTLALNGWALPAAHLQIAQLREKAIGTFVSSYAKSASDSLEIPGSKYTIYWNRFDSDTETYHNMVIIETEGTTMTRYVVAREGKIEVDKKSGTFLVNLTDCRVGQLDYKKSAKGTNKTLNGLSTGEIGSLSYIIPLNSKYEQRAQKFENMPMERLFSERKSRREKIRSHEKIFKHPKRELERWEKEYTKLSQEKKRYSALVKNAEERRSASLLRAKKAKAQMEKLNDDIASLEEDMKFVGGRLDYFKEEMTALDTELERLKGKLDVLEKKRLVQKTDGDDKQVEQIDKEIDHIKERIKKLETDRDRVEKSSEEYKKKLDTYITNLKKARDSLKENEIIEQECRKEESEAIEIINRNKPLEAKYIKYRSDAQAMANRARLQVAEREISVEIQKRLAMSFASLAFVLVGAPLGILAKHGNVLIGFGISFILAYFLYYPLFMTGELLATDHYLPPAPAMWMGNLIFGIIGIGLSRVIFKR